MPFTTKPQPNKYTCILSNLKTLKLMGNRIILSIAYIVMLGCNGLANGLPLNGKNTGELSDQYPNLFVPAGLTFSIWGVIYLLLLAFVVNVWIKKKEVSKWIIINFFANASWIFAWHYEILWLSLVIMLVILGSLILINQENKTSDTLSKAAFGVYLGWICVATIANVTALLVGSDWHGGFMSEANWTFIMIAIGGAIGAFAITQLNNSFIAAAILWAFLGIYIKRSAALEQYPIITIGILLGGAFVLVGVFLSLKNKKLNV